VRQKSKRNSLRFCEKWDDKLFIVVIINAIVIVVIIIVVVGCNAAAANRTIKRSVVVAVQARPLLFTQLCAHLMHPLRTAVALDHGFVAGVLHAMRLFAHRARAFLAVCDGALITHCAVLMPLARLCRSTAPTQSTIIAFPTPTRHSVF